MKISVAMTTYNGKKYISELLDSIREQTVLPEEVIIVDDCSTDGTPNLVRDYISKYQLLNWRVIINDSNVGWRINFRRAIKACNGEVIFLCDQDDIWKKTKIEEMSQIMENNHAIEVLVSNYEPLNEESDEDVTIRRKVGKEGEVKQYPFRYGALSVLRPGCTYCVRSQILPFVFANDSENIAHDAMLWGCAAVRGSLYLYNKDTIVYRRHKDCASLSADQYGIEKKKKQIEYDISVEQLFGDICRRNDYAKQADVLKKRLDFSRKRLETIKSGKTVKTAFFVLTHLKYYATFRNALSDIYVVVKGK